MKDLSIRIGTLVDRIADNTRRSPRRIFLRALEEMVELGYAIGVSVGEMHSAVADSTHNQCLKASDQLGATIFPSQHLPIYSVHEILKELADTKLVLADLMYVVGLDGSQVETQIAKKLAVLESAGLEDFNTDGNTFYLKKRHIK